MGAPFKKARNIAAELHALNKVEDVDAEMSMGICIKLLSFQALRLAIGSREDRDLPTL